MVRATWHRVDFPQAHDSYNGVGFDVASDAALVCLSSVEKGAAGRIYALPRERPSGADAACGAAAPRMLADLSEMCGERTSEGIPQGKVHSLYERGSDGRLYFATHVGFYIKGDGDMDRPDMGAGYSGGHVLAIDGAGEGARVHDYGVPVEGEGLISFALDARRGHCYAVSWPSGAFVHATLPGFEAHSAGGELATSEEFQAAGMDAAATDALRNAVRGRESFSLESGLRGGIIHGLFGGGELAEGTSDAYQVLPRTLLVDPETGLLYMTLQGGEIVAYSPAMRDVVVLSTSMRLKYFGDVRVGAGSMGFHLRQGMWHARERAFLATHGNSGYLYWFDPPRPGRPAAAIRLLERICSAPSREAGQEDMFSYGYLGLCLSSDGNRVVYLTGGPIDGVSATKERTGRGEALGDENCHVVSYDLYARRLVDHGAIVFDGGGHPTFVNSLAMAPDGTLFSCGRPDPGVERTMPFVIEAAELWRPAEGADAPSAPPAQAVPRDHLWGQYEQHCIAGCAWDVDEGVYCDRLSAAPGDSVGLCVSTSRARQTLLVFREGDGRVLVATHSLRGLRLQPTRCSDNSGDGGRGEPCTDGFGWEITYRLPIPRTWPSGVYVVQVESGLGPREAMFVVRPAEGAARAPVAWVLADFTLQAYNTAGGRSSYNYASRDKRMATRLSFDRPQALGAGLGTFPAWDAPFLAFLARNGYCVDFYSQADLCAGSNPLVEGGYALCLRVGHDEYVTRSEVDHMTAFVEQGGNLAVFGGNTFFWQVRTEAAGRTLVCHKDAAWGLPDEASRDPVRERDPEAETVLWNDLPGEAGRLVRSLIGVTQLGFHNFLWKPSQQAMWPGADVKVGGRCLDAQSGHGGFTCQRPAHWAFDGLAIARGDTFGSDETICGPEVDGLTIAEGADGLPAPSGADGVDPSQWTILATCKIARMLEKAWGTGAVLCHDSAGSEAGGSVFNASTIEWSHGLGTSVVVAGITRNVLDKFGARRG